MRWNQVVEQLKTRLGNANGFPDAAVGPNLKRGEAASLLVVATMAASEAKASWDWYPAALAALNWRAPGDKFPPITEVNTPVERDGADYVWTSLDNLASKLDAANVSVHALDIPPAPDALAFVEKMAWERLKGNEANTKWTPGDPNAGEPNPAYAQRVPSPIPDQPPKVPIQPQPPVTGPARTDWGGLIKLGLLLYAGKKLLDSLD